MDGTNTPPLVHSPSTARSSFSSLANSSRPPPPPQTPSWSKRHASLDSPRERPTVVEPGSFGAPTPDPPRVHTPPSSPSARAYDYPFLPSHEPRGADRPSVTVDVRPDVYVLVCRMPHFNHSSITVATRRGRLLVIAADRWDTEHEPSLFDLDAPSPAHFERRVTFGWDADMSRIKAEFDGQVLHVSVPRRHFANTVGLPRITSNRASAPGGMRFNTTEVSSVQSDLEMSRSRSNQEPQRRDVAWPLG